MDNYRLLDHKDEIFKMVKKAPEKEIGEIWQTVGPLRHVYKITSLEVLTDALIFHTTQNFVLDSAHPLFIHINYKNLIFKLNHEEIKCSKNQLSCTYPKEAKAIESRKLTRTKLPRKSNMHLTLRTLTPNGPINLKVNLDDVSEYGLGIKVSILNSEYFHGSAIFKIIKICGRNHTEDSNLTIRHIYEKVHKTFLGVGMESDIPFSERFFEILKEEIKRERFRMSS